MRILVTNDDGIQAPGIKVLERIARGLSEDVWVVAPETQQSASSHSLTLHRPLRLRRISRRRYAVNGTPTDCVFLAFNKILADGLPDLVLSGVNDGPNVGEDVTYSGTIAAAMEATLFGVPAVAFSQAYGDGRKHHWATAEQWAGRLLPMLIERGWPKRVLINVNLPRLAGCRRARVQGRASGIARRSTIPWRSGSTPGAGPTSGSEHSCLRPAAGSAAPT